MKRAATLLAILVLMFEGCTRVQDKTQTNSSTDQVFSSTPPFKTIEPDRYQAIRVVTTTNAAGTSELFRTLIAKDGSSRREETLGPKQLIYLYLPQGTFVLLPAAHIYSDSIPATESPSASPSPDESTELILHEGASEALYGQLGQEVIDGRRLQKYQIVVNNTAATNVTNNETVVWVDDELGMPVKTEIKSGNGNRTIIELTQIKREVDKQLFQIPSDYRKVTPEEIRQALKHQ